MDWEYLRRVMLAASLVLAALLLFVFRSATCLIFLYVAGFIVWSSLMRPDSVFAIQEDFRCAERTRQIQRFKEAMNAGRIRQGEAAEDWEIECESVKPLVFVFHSSAYGADVERVREVCEHAAPMFGAIRFTIERKPTEDGKALQYRIGFYSLSPSATAEEMSVEYEHIADLKPRYDAIPVGKFEDGEIAYMNFKNRNSLIGGLPRVGKSNLLAVICMGVVRCGKACRLVVISSKTLDYMAYKNHAELYEQPEEILRALKGISNTIEKRKRYCIDHRIKKMPEPSKKHPAIIILVDEYAVLKSAKTISDDGKKMRKIGDEIEAELTKIVAQGGFANCSTVITSQRLSSQVIDTNLRELIAGNAVTFANSRQTSTEFIMGENWQDAPAHEIPITAAGVAYIYVEGEMQKPRIMKTAHMDDKTEEEYIEAIEEEGRI